MAKRRFRIDTGRYGGELVIGKINADFVEFMRDYDESDLIDTVTGYEWEDEEMGIADAPKPKDEFYAWFECDDIEHLNNAYADGDWVYTEVPADGSDDFAYDDEVSFEAYHLYGREAYHDDELPEPSDYLSEEDIENMFPVLVFHSGEKGGFASYFVETDGEDFNPKKLAFSSVETNISEIIENVYYDKEELDANYDYNDTNGKGYYASVGYMNPKYRDNPEQYTQEYLEEEGYWECYEDNLLEDE